MHYVGDGSVDIFWRSLSSTGGCGFASSRPAPGATVVAHLQLDVSALGLLHTVLQLGSDRRVIRYMLTQETLRGSITMQVELKK
jgi:hypothetical protein